MPNTLPLPRRDPDATGGGALPTAQQQLLLSAALFRSPAALAAWQAWRAQVDLHRDFIEPGSYRLLPLVHHNLLHARGNAAQSTHPHPHSVDPHSIDTASAARLKQRRLQNLVKNQRLLYACAHLLEMFHAAGIDTLVLKGAALIGNQFYADPSLRPMDDFDVLIRRAQAPAALALLEQEGWRAGSLDYAHFDADFLAVRHAQNFGGPGRANFDLHWHALPGSMDTGLDDRLWENAQPLTLHKTATHTLSPTDHLLHICVHGAAWASIPPVRWIADAVMILRTGQTDEPGQIDSAIDWERLVELATSYQLSLTLHYTLGYLQEHILPQAAGVEPIPSPVLERLAQAPVSSIERSLFRAHTQRSTKLGQLPLLWARYRYYAARYKMHGAPDRPARRLSFPRYIAVFYGYRGLFDVLRWAVRRSATRMRRLILGS